MYKTPVVAALDGGRAILDVYGMEDRGVELKEDDSPLTLADRRAHEIIVKHLVPTGLPVLSEEGKHLPYAHRKSWSSFWLVDPLDGTREFIKRNGEFTVNIALVSDRRPVFGVIYVPVSDLLYIGVTNPESSAESEVPDLVPGSGQPLARKIAQASLQRPNTHPFTWPGIDLPAIRHQTTGVVASRSHPSEATEAYIQGIRETHPNVRIISRGSSLKMCMVAEGEADSYPRFGPTMEWDTAAGQAIAEASGATVQVFETGKPMTYNKEELRNPWFIAHRQASRTSKRNI